MSVETESALRPDEWKRRGVDGWQDAIIVATERGVQCHTDEEDTGPFPARKVMALANLSLTLVKDASAITQAHVDICTSAAWYFRQAARKANPGADPRVMGALSVAERGARDLSAILRALVPPQ